jgi:UDP-N-acetylmuramoyl-tripeptide--D-alanyl-D-alanine ligase
LNQLDIVGMTVIDDTYNANPLSMRFGLDTLASIATPASRRVAVLGFMAELGPESPRYHAEVGAYARTRADLLIGVGEPAKLYKPDIWFETSDACADQIGTLLRTGDCVLVKGSFSARMARVVKKLSALSGREN